jgi:hypothetical protein
MTKNNMTVICHPTYSPDLASCNFSLDSHHFDTIKVIEAESQAMLNTHITGLAGCI